MSLSLPVRFVSVLPFTETQKDMYRWLRDRDRYYHVLGALNSGGFSQAFLALPGSETSPDYSKPLLVLKLPNLSPSADSRSVADRLSYIQRKTREEWLLSSKKLEDCDFANAIIDFCVVYLEGGSDVQLIWATVQPYLDTGLELNDYLISQHLRPKRYKDEKGAEVDNFYGIPKWADWLRIVRPIATSLSSIHLRRVVHGDVWPPNIYMCTSESDELYCKFIDFGEAFTVLPTGDLRDQKDHAYRAPERGSTQTLVTEQADVYSFGKLLLYLASGSQPIIPPTVVGHARRQRVRELILERNRTLAKENPWIIDLICHCISLDPVERPRMVDVVFEIDNYIDKNRHTFQPSLIPFRLKKLRKDLIGLVTRDDVLGRLAVNKLLELETLLQSMGTDMVDLVDTRDRLLSSLVELFRSLEKGDIYSCITSANLWQEDALGLDGRFTTATVEAAKRGVNVHRSFVFSVQEVGLEWVENIVERLQAPGTSSTSDGGKDRLKRLLLQALGSYRGSVEFRTTIEESMRRQERIGRDRVIAVLRTMKLMIDTWVDPAFVCTTEFGATPWQGLEEVLGLYLGLCPVGTTSQLLELKAANPVSLIAKHNGSGRTTEWLLMATDCRGRREYGTPGSINRPQLRGVKVYRSIHKVPPDRKLDLEKVLASKSVNVGCWVSELLELVEAADREL